MKKRIWFILTIASSIVFVSLYLIYDSKGYEYGVGCTFCNKTMPYNLKPHDGTQFSFTLKDEDNFELVGIGFRYATTDFIIKNFLAYGYNDTSVVVKCTDSLNNIRYLISYETGYKSKKGNPEVSFKDLDNNNFEQIKNNYQWVQINEEMAVTIERMKLLFILGSLLSLFVLIKLLFNLKNNKTR